LVGMINTSLPFPVTSSLVTETQYVDNNVQC